MKKRMMTAAVLAAALLFTACSSGSPASSASEEPAGSAQTESSVSEAEAEAESSAPEEQESSASKEEQTSEQASETAPESSAPEETEAASSVIPGIYINTEYYSDYEEGRAFLTGRSEILSLTEESAAVYPALADTVKAYYAERKAAMDAEYESQLADAHDMYKESQDAFPDSGFTLEYRQQADRCDSRVLSVAEWYSVFSGGAHGGYGNLAATFDTQTGKKLALSDVISDVSALPSVLAQKLKEEYADVDFFEEDLETALQNYIPESGEPYFVWDLDNNGVTFYFQCYDLAPYACGMQIITLPYSDELVNDNYAPVSEAYVFNTDLYMNHKEDLDGDGKPEEISLQAEQNEYGDIEKIVLSVDGNSVEKEVMAYSGKAIYLKLENGISYLYVDLSGENDWHQLLVYSLAADGPAYAGEVDLGMYHAYTKDETIISYELTDPNHFELSSRTDLMSTTTIYRTYKVGSNGLPEAVDELWDMNGFFSITAKRDVAAAIVDEAGNVVSESGTIPKGTEVEFFRTNDKDFVDLKASDGTLYRVTVEYRDYEQYINDMLLDDCFSGVMFAG